MASKKQNGEPLGEFCTSYKTVAKKPPERLEKFCFDSSQSRTKAAQNGKKGGIASGISKREKKLLKEVAQEILWMDIGGGMTAQEKLTKKIYDMATSDSEKIKLPDVIRALEVLRDTAGQSPTQKKEITGADGEPLPPLVIKIPESFSDVSHDGTRE